ncbi:hypothetical protein EJB05_26225, partial [Eragrostis curvula]
MAIEVAQPYNVQHRKPARFDPKEWRRRRLLRRWRSERWDVIHLLARRDLAMSDGEQSVTVIQNERGVVSDTLMKDPTLAAGLLRLHFHDASCRAATRRFSSTPRTTTPPRRTRWPTRACGYEVIEKIKEILESQCPGVVSCADILALAARDAVFMAGGPYYGVPGGRRDGTLSSAADTLTVLPAPVLNATTLVAIFASHGFMAQDMVALSGGHTRRPRWTRPWCPSSAPRSAAPTGMTPPRRRSTGPAMRSMLSSLLQGAAGEAGTAHLRPDAVRVEGDESAGQQVGLSLLVQVMNCNVSAVIG